MQELRQNLAASFARVFKALFLAPARYLKDLNARLLRRRCECKAGRTFHQVVWKRGQSERILERIHSTDHGRDGAEGNKDTDVERTRGHAASPFFTKLCPELRRHILILAFGERIFEMSLQLTPNPLEWLQRRNSREAWVHHPLAVHHDRWKWSSNECSQLAKIWNIWFPKGHPDYDPDLVPQYEAGGDDIGNEVEWALAEYLGLRMVRRKLLVLKIANHTCLGGSDRIGVIGWLLSCKQAYVEGWEVLYRTNTFNIGCPVLIQSMQDVLYSNVVSSLRSLELRIDLRKMRSNTWLDSFGLRAQSLDMPKAVMFPSLVSLRIDFTCETLKDGEDELFANDQTPNQNPTDRVKVLLRTVDDLIDRIVPPSTKVSICFGRNVWCWYRFIDLGLVEEQGRRLTSPQLSELGGIKCWKQADMDGSHISASDTSQEPGRNQRGAARRQGYWIHLSPEAAVNIERGDYRRRKLYYSKTQIQSKDGSELPLFLR